MASLLWVGTPPGGYFFGKVRFNQDLAGYLQTLAALWVGMSFGVAKHRIVKLGNQYAIAGRKSRFPVSGKTRRKGKAEAGFPFGGMTRKEGQKESRYFAGSLVADEQAVGEEEKGA